LKFLLVPCLTSLIIQFHQGYVCCRLQCIDDMECPFIHLRMRHCGHNQIVSAQSSLDLPKKNCLPLGLSTDCLPDDDDYQEFLDLFAGDNCSNLNMLEPRFFLAEMNSILTTGERFGFDIYRSGGNSSIVGAAPPGLTDFTTGLGAWLEQEQTINNAYNFSL
jgi:hypothetical protein